MSRSKCRPLQEKASPAPDKTKPLTRNKGAWVIGFNGGRSVRSIRAKVGVSFSVCLIVCLWNVNLLAHCHWEILKTRSYTRNFMPHRPFHTVLFTQFYASWMFIPFNQTGMRSNGGLWWYPWHQRVQETRVIFGNKTSRIPHCRYGISASTVVSVMTTCLAWDSASC